MIMKEITKYLPNKDKVLTLVPTTLIICGIIVTTQWGNLGIPLIGIGLHYTIKHWLKSK
jgi:hypothetical protein